MVAGGDFFVDDFAMDHVYAFGTVELYSVFAAVEFGGIDGEFARSCADTSFASQDMASAPGQISLSNMKKIQEILNEN